MEILGLILVIFLYTTVLVMLFFYLIPAFMRKFDIANSILPFLFIHVLFCCLVMLCGIFMMRGSFNVTYDTSVDYSNLLFFFVPMFVIVEVIDAIIRSYTLKNTNPFYRMGRMVLPTFMIISYFAATCILYYAVHYYILLTVW